MFGRVTTAANDPLRGRGLLADPDARNPSMVEELSPDALKDRLERGDDIQVVDIRQPAEFAAGHIPGAVNLPFHRFVREVAEHEWSDDIVVVCPLGESSLQAARLLEAYEGVDEAATVSNLSGGYQAWEYELENGSESPIEE